MKRSLCILLCVLFLIGLCGCSTPLSGSGEPVSFYYRRADFQYHGTDNVIVPEQREISGHGGDLHYMISLYLVGPLDDSLVSKIDSLSADDELVVLGTSALSYEQSSALDSAFRRDRKSVV